MRKEVKRTVDETEARVRQILTEGNGHLAAIAERLLEKEVLEGEELRQLLGKPTAVGAENKAVL